MTTLENAFSSEFDIGKACVLLRVETVYDDDVIIKLTDLMKSQRQILRLYEENGNRVENYDDGESKKDTVVHRDNIRRPLAVLLVTQGD